MGAISTKSKCLSTASCWAARPDITPSCSPSAVITRTSRARISSLIRKLSFAMTIHLQGHKVSFTAYKKIKAGRRNPPAKKFISNPVECRPQGEKREASALLLKYDTIDDMVCQGVILENLKVCEIGKP